MKTLLYVSPLRALLIVGVLAVAAIPSAVALTNTGHTVSVRDYHDMQALRLRVRQWLDRTSGTAAASKVTKIACVPTERQDARCTVTGSSGLTSTLFARISRDGTSVAFVALS